MIKAWSYSRLEVYETCPYRAYLQYVERIPTPPLVCPPDKDEHPLERGTRIHELAERYIKESVLLAEELQNFSEAFPVLRARYQSEPATTFVEQDWAIKSDWSPTGWLSPDAWCRLKLDYGQLDNAEVTVIDFKTGKKYPMKHVPQGQLYAAVCSTRFPEAEKFKVSFWYLDTGETLEQEYSKTSVQMFKDDFDRRAQAMLAATDFPPRTSPYACRFCPYGEGRDGNSHCDYRFSFST